MDTIRYQQVWRHFLATFHQRRPPDQTQAAVLPHGWYGRTDKRTFVSATGRTPIVPSTEVLDVMRERESGIFPRFTYLSPGGFYHASIDEYEEYEGPRNNVATKVAPPVTVQPRK